MSFNLKYFKTEESLSPRDRQLIARLLKRPKLRITVFRIYTLSDLGVLSNLIGSLSLANYYSMSARWI